VSSKVEQKAKHDDQRHQARLKSTTCMEREGALTKVLLPKCSGTAAGACGARARGRWRSALGLGDGSARPRARGRRRSALGTAALGLGLADGGAQARGRRHS
jgi:hypothetical protein